MPYVWAPLYAQKEPRQRKGRGEPRESNKQRYIWQESVLVCPLKELLIDFAVCLTAILVIVRLISLSRKVKKLMADTSKLTAAVSKLATDVQALIASDANNQAAIDAATSAVAAVDATVAAATPAAPAPTPAPATPPAA